MNAENNWWGDLDPSDSTRGDIDFTPFATSPFSEYDNSSCNGFNAEYFNNQTLSGIPTITTQVNKISGVWSKGSPHPQIPNDHFSARYTGNIEIPLGRKGKTHKFTLKADDGVRFWIDGSFIVDDWTNHPMRTYERILNLEPGSHLLKIEYYENTGGAVLTLNQDY